MSRLSGYFFNVFGQFLAILFVCGYFGLLWDVFVECDLLGLFFLRIVFAWGERSSLVPALGLAWSEDFLGDVRDFSSCLGCFMLFFACFLLFVGFFLPLLDAVPCCFCLGSIGFCWEGKGGRKDEFCFHPRRAEQRERSERREALRREETPRSLRSSLWCCSCWC